MSSVDDKPKDVELDIVPDRTDSTVQLNDRQLTSSSAFSAADAPKDDKKKADDDKKKAEEKKPTELVPLLALFRFATLTDKIYMIVGLVGAAGTGMGLPLFSVLFGNILSGFNGDLNEILDNVKRQCVYFLIVGAAMFILGTVGLSFWLYVSEHLTKRVREEYLKSVLRQHVGWFDVHKPGEVSAQLSTDSSDFNSGTGDKIATAAQHLVTFFGGLIIGLVRGWQLALLILAVTPVMGGLIGSFSVVMSKFNKQSQEAYSEAANIADEALQGVRTVTAFGAQKKESARYESKLGAAKAAGIKAGFTQGGTMAATYFVMFSCYALCLWFGGWLIRQRVHNPWPNADWSGGDVFTVFFALLMASQSMGLVGPCFQAITTARTAAFRLYRVIDTKSEIDVEADVGDTIPNLQGDIRFQGVNFTYPARKDAPVFSEFDLEIAPGKTTALVGHSGCGKSTIIGLLERFYDVSGGQVLVDGRNVKSLRLKWWREQIGLVAQEPVLFDGTVRENIAYGREGLTQAQIEAAAKAANAHEFITKLPGGYDARVGDNGALLSGGQKQRVAIARAIVRNPPILLLDEATSALDNESERLVKDALENLMTQRTSVVIAHRLTTIRKADVICVLSEGRVIEKGNHDQLMARNGAYANLVAAQEAGEAVSLDSDDENDDDDDAKQPPSPVRSVLPNGELEVAVDINTASLASATASADGSLAPPSMARGTSDSTQKPKKTPGSINRKRPKDEDKTKKKDDKEKDKDSKELPKEDVPVVPNGRVWSVAFREAAPWVVLAVVGAAATGAFMPLWGFIFGDMTAALFEPDYDKQERDTRFWALLFVALGVVLALAELAKYGGFGVAGERMTEKLRGDTFKAFLRQEMAFFDEDKHNPRILAGRLSTDASLVHQGTTQKASMTVQVLSTMVSGLVIAFYYDWALTLVTLAMFPPLTIASQIQLKMFTGFSAAGKKNFEAAEKVASEAIGNIRTVASLTVEQYVLKRFSNRLEAPMKDSARSAFVAGVAMGFSQFVIFATYALCFWYGAKRVQDGPLSFADMMKCVFCVVMAAVGSGQVMQLAPDFAKAAIARDHIFYYLDRKSKIDTESTEGTRPVLNQGRVTFNDLKFSYPTRPEQTVLNGLNIDIKPGSTVALVGPSGCGKSTLVSLLMRMYEPTSGSICIDDNDIVKMNVNSLRSQLAVVSQEPRLFDASIAENIAYGKDGATMEEVIAAAKQANIHDVIMGFPKQYETTVGTKGGQLSGGQKQRVAIARALIRQPRVLLLDEATSALDTQSERVVQDALEALMRTKDRTIICIAHRLSTIQNCDVIFVLDKGGIVEQGNHSQLITRNGVYAALARAAEAGAGVST